MVWTHPRLRKAPQKDPTLFTNKYWQACFIAWLNHLRARNPVSETIVHYRCYLKRFFTDPQKAPDTYTRKDVEKFIQVPNKKTGKIGSRSYNGKLTALSSFYRYAGTYEIEFRGTIKPLMTRNPPTHGIKFVRNSSRSRAMTDEELTRLFRVIDESTIVGPITKLRDRALFLTYLWSGRRRREITELRWGNIEEAKFYDRGKLRAGWLYHWRGKGHTEIDDSAEMPEDAVNAIREYLEADGRWGNMTANDPIFPGAYGEPITPSHINNRFRFYCDLAGIESGLHRFRHTAARARYEENNHDIEEVSQFLRHKSIATTQIYIQAGKREADTVAPRLRRRFGHL